ncbi:hypothetical protein COB55_02090 [Candidatus Wolfebacteria bacterium]|nr:MAG: hypothetical protein COB55_02090 [Candidatus Wolfebacteria bacterium]
MTTEKIKLNEYLRDILEDRRMTLNSLAQQLDVPNGTVKGWMVANRYPLVTIERMIEIGFVSEKSFDELNQKYQFTCTRPRRSAATCKSNVQLMPSVFSTIDEMCSRQITYDKFGILVRKLFSELADGDTFWLSTNDEIPFEWTFSGFQIIGDKIVSAIDRGAKLVYIITDSSEHRARFAEFIQNIANASSNTKNQSRVCLKQVTRDDAAPLGSKVAMFLNSRSSIFTTMVNTRASGDMWVNYLPSQKFRDHVSGSISRAKQIS